MSPRPLGRTLLSSLLVVPGLVIGGVAGAYWTSGGSGSASGSTGTTLAVTLSPGTPSLALYPGGQANVTVSASNPNTFSVVLASLALDTSQGTAGFAVDGGHSGCGVATLTFTTQTNGGVGWTVGAKVGAVNGTLPITLTNALGMGTAAADACQGATFTVYLTSGP